jgi:hypothetical protein
MALGYAWGVKTNGFIDEARPLSGLGVLHVGTSPNSSHNVCQPKWDVLNPVPISEAGHIKSLEACNILTNEL